MAITMDDNEYNNIFAGKQMNYNQDYYDSLEAEIAIKQHENNQFNNLIKENPVAYSYLKSSIINNENRIQQLKNALNTVRSKANIYQKTYTSKQFVPQTIPTDYSKDISGMESAYTTKAANIQQAQNLTKEATEASETTDIDNKLNELNNKSSSMQNEISNLWDTITKNSNNPEIWQPAYSRRQQLINEISVIRAQINDLNKVKSERNANLQRAQGDIAQYKQIEQQNIAGQDELRIQRERYAAAMQQNRLRSKTLGMGNEMLKGLR